MRVPAVIVTAAVVTAGVWGTTAAAHNKRDVGREVLAANDGWASLGTGTTGGSAAADEQVYTVRTRAELLAALNNGVSSPTSSSSPSNEPKIIYVDGTIDFNVDDDNQPLTCEDYYRNGFTIEAFLEQFDPEGPWGRVPPSGPLEDARIASRNAQRIAYASGPARIRRSSGSARTRRCAGSG